MSKSKYPNELDSSIEIPAVRDNIVEVGSDVLNSLRSAIFQIERTLGVNPQGAVGNSVADRLSRALDGNGNISKEALSMAGLVSGPISNSDVSSSAAISESKLNLDFPTSLIQQEVSALVREIDRYIARLNEIAAILTAHVHLDATNRHRAMAITVGEIGNGEQSIATNSMPISTAQEVFEDIYGSHINYDGSDISSLNKSHSANQVFFDRVNVSGDIQSDDTQGAIEETIGLANRQLSDHQNIFHQNGSARNIVSTSVTDVDDGRTTVAETEASHAKYSTYDTKNISVISLDSPQEFSSYGVETSDVVRVFVSDDETRDMQVSSATIVDGKVESVEVFGRLVADSFSGDMVKILKNKNQVSIQTGLLLGVVQFADETSSGIIQISNPESAAIVTSGCRPSEISDSNRYFKLTFEGVTEVTLDLYSSLDPAQTIDTIIREINEQLAEGAYSALAYRLDREGLASEIAIVHNIPSNGTTAYTLTASRVDDDGIDSIGFAHIDGIEMDSQPDNEYFIQGFAYSGLEEKINSEVPVISSGTRSIDTGTADFTKEELAKHDIVNIVSSAGANSYRIDLASSSKIVTDSGQPKLSGLSTPQFLVYKNSISFESLNFDEVSLSPAHALVDIFMDKDRNILSKKRMVYGAPYDASARARFSISDFSGDLSGDAELSISIDPLGSSVLFSLDGGPTEELSIGSRIYKDIFSGASNLKIRLYIDDVSGLYSYIDSLTDDSTLVSIVGTGGVNTEENLFLGRLLVESGNGRITGAGSTTPRVFSHVEYGLVGAKDLGSSAISKVLETPISEMRSNGVIRGIELSTAASGAMEDDKYVIDISSGICYVKGVRLEITEKTSLKTEIDNSGAMGGDKIFVAINEWGEVVFAIADAVTCASPFDSGEFCAIGSIEWDGSTAIAYDLRLFIDNLDLKLLNSISVSPQPGMGHFSEVGPAIKYAKRFSEVFPNAGVPTVHLKSGVHKVVIDTGVGTADYSNDIGRQAASDYGTWINFPVNITGEGHSTVLDIITIHNDQGEEDDDRADSGNPDHDSFLYIAGPGFTSTPDGNSDVLSSGFVTLSNFRMRLCALYLIDPSVKDADGNKLNWGVKVDNVIFDQSEKSGWGQYNRGVVLTFVDTVSSTIGSGNIAISNCEFLNSHIITSNWDAADHRNISIVNNTFRGSGDGLEDGEDHYAVYIAGSGHIFGVVDCPPENNVEFRGNINADNDGSSPTSYINSSGTKPWGDRISRNLAIGGDVGIGTSAPSEMLHLRAKNGGRAFINLEADPDNSSESGNAGIKMSQDDGFTEAQVRLEGEAGDTYTDSLKNALCLNSTLNTATNSAVQIGAGGDMTLTVRTGSAGPTHGRVGIMNNDPQELLDVGGFDDTTSNKIRLNIGDASSRGVFKISQNNVQKASLGQDVDRDIVSITYGSIGQSHICINADGDVGIRQSEPGGVVAGRGSEVLLHIGDESLNNDAVVILEARNGRDLGYAFQRVDHGDDPYLSTSHVGGDDGGLFAFKGLNSSSPSYENICYLTAHSIDHDGLFVSNSLNGSTETFMAGSPSPRSSADWASIGDYRGWGRIVVQQSSENTGSSIFGGIGFVSESKANNWCIGAYDTGAEGKLGFWHKTSLTGGVSITAYISSTGSQGLNFTGQHRSSPVSKELFSDSNIGLIVSSSGKYKNLLGSGRQVNINESLPIVELSKDKKDKRAFGVISFAEDENKDTREYEVGNFTFFNKKEKDDNRIVINSLGEGAVWVCNINGSFENGDYITTCEIPGYGMRQDDDVLHNYTVAKITCDCDFDLNSNIYDCVEFEFNGKTYKRAFVGCTYHCG
jgi:hypothetical protein